MGNTSAVGPEDNDLRAALDEALSAAGDKIYWHDKLDVLERAVADWASDAVGERGLADQLAAATQAMFDSMWSCNACGPHPGSRANWCDAGCGRDYNRMTAPVTDPPEPYFVTHRRVLDLLARFHETQESADVQ